jgi:hypothetical protein
MSTVGTGALTLVGLPVASASNLAPAIIKAGSSRTGTRRRSAPVAGSTTVLTGLRGGVGVQTSPVGQAHFWPSRP